MSEAKFTKAPWRVSHMCQGRGAVGADHRRSVAEVWALDDDVPQEEMRANAHLIAAAPELYEIGQYLLDIFDHPTRSVTIFDADNLRAILAKVRGEK